MLPHVASNRLSNNKIHFWNFGHPNVFRVILYSFTLFLFQDFVTRQSTVESTQQKLYDEVKEQSAKFGDDVKYLAEFTAGVKKFDPWIQKADAKRAVGMLKPKNLQEALDQLDGSQVKKVAKSCLKHDWKCFSVLDREKDLGNSKDEILIFLWLRIFFEIPK